MVALRFSIRRPYFFTASDRDGAGSDGTPGTPGGTGPRLDVCDGHVTARVEERHRSIEFIGLLKDLDAWYPPECTIRLILDNHSAHTSEETRTFLATRPNRFNLKTAVDEAFDRQAGVGRYRLLTRAAQ